MSETQDSDRHGAEVEQNLRNSHVDIAVVDGDGQNAYLKIGGEVIQTTEMEARTLATEIGEKLSENADTSAGRPHIEVEGGPDRDVFLNGDRMDRHDGGVDHVQVEAVVDNQTVVVTIGVATGLFASVAVWDFPNPEPLFESELERAEDAEHPTFEGEWNGNGFTIEVLEREEADA